MRLYNYLIFNSHSLHLQISPKQSAEDFYAGTLKAFLSLNRTTFLNISSHAPLEGRWLRGRKYNKSQKN